MQPVSHLEIADATPCTPPFTYGLKAQSSASNSPLHTSSHKKTWRSPLKSLRSRRKSNGPVDQSPTTLKRTQSIFDLFHSSRSEGPGSTEALKDGIRGQRPKSASPAKNITNENDCDPPRPKRSKSFGELLGKNISDKVSSKYDTVSGSSRRQAKYERHIHPGFNLYSMNNGSWEEIVSGGTPEAITLSLQQEWYIQKLETEMDAFWREQAMDSLKHYQRENHLGLDGDFASSINSWQSSSQTLRGVEETILNRSAAKCEDEEDKLIPGEPYLEPWLLSSKHSFAAPYDSKYYMTEPPPGHKSPNQLGEGSGYKAMHHNNIVSFHQHDLHKPEIIRISDFNGGCTYSAFRGRLAAKDVTPQTPSVKQSPPRATSDTSIAERIQLTVDEMTNNRYMSPSVDGPDLKFVDRILVDSMSLRTPPEPPSTCCSSAVALPYKIDSIQPQTTEGKKESALHTQQLPKCPGIVCSKKRVEGQNARPCSRESRQVSTGAVRVKFPDTKIRAAYIGVYPSNSAAIAGIFEKNHGQLSNICSYDRENRIIHVHPVQCAITSKELRQQGLEPIWLPLQNDLGTEGLLGAMMSEGILFQKNSPSAPTSVSSSTFSCSQSKPSPIDAIVMNKQSRTPLQPLEYNSAVSHIDTMLDPIRKSSKHVPATDAQTGRAASTLDSRTGIPAKPSVARLSNLPTHVGGVTDASFRVKMDPVSKFQRSPIPSHVHNESYSEDSAIFPFDYTSELDDSAISQASGSSEEYNRIMMDNESDIGDVYPWQYFLDSDDEPNLHRMKNKKAHKDYNIDTWRKTGSETDCINKSPVFQRPYYIWTTKDISGTQRGGTQRQANAQDSVNDSKYFDNGERLGPNVSVKHKNTVGSSLDSQSNSTSTDGESSSNPSHASGFPFTAYAAQLLGSGRRCMSREHSDLTNEDEIQWPIVSRFDPGAKLPSEGKKVDRLRTVPLSRHNGERQSVTASKDLRHEPSSPINVLPGIDEGVEIDGNMRSTEMPLKFANGDKTPETTIPVSYSKRLRDYMPNEGSPVSPLINKEKNVAGLVEIFQARGMIGPGLISGLQRPQALSNSANHCSGGLSDSSTRIVTPSGAVYSPSGAAPRLPYRPSPVKRVPTPHSFSITDASLSDASSLFGEQLGGLERGAVGRSGNGQPEGNEWYFRDGQIYG